jgi:hypothetical protein
VAATCTTQKKHKSRKTMLFAGFEPAIPLIKRLQTYALDPRILNLGKNVAKGGGSLKYQPFKHQKNVPNSHCLRGWIDLTDDVE